MTQPSSPENPQSSPSRGHFDGRRFRNPNHVNRTWLDILRWKLTARPVKWPREVSVRQQKPAAVPADGGIAVTWINHSTFLLQGPFGAVLTDPVFSERVGLFGMIGPRRVHAPGVRFEDLPRIDLILLSHDHYDHCDLPTLRRLARRDNPLVITPLGNGKLVARAGLRRVRELDWWEQTEALPGCLGVTCTPARHWSNRLSGQRNGRLWGGFWLRTPGRSVYFSGDTGYEPGLGAGIRERLGVPDLAMLPIGAYEPRWFMHPQHCSPGEAVAMHRELGARRSVAMHWGCWQLADDGREEPVEALHKALDEQGLLHEEFLAMEPGESLVI